MRSPLVLRGFLLGIALALAALLGVLVGDRRPPVERHSGRIVPDPVFPGQSVTVEWRASTHRACHGLVHRQVVDSAGTVWSLDAEPSSYAAGSRFLRRTFTIPVGTAWGPAKYRATVKFACNPLHYWWPITVEGPEVPFNVAPPKG